MTFTLQAPGALWHAIRDDLLSTPELERAAVGFAGLSGDGSRRRLLLRDWAPVPTDEYLVQLAYHLEVSPTFWARNAKRARQTGEAMVILHSHPGDQHVPAFSPSDTGGEARLIPKIHARAAVPVAAVVLSPGGHQARLTQPGVGAQPLNVHLGHLCPAARSAQVGSDRFDRQLRALGRDSQALLAGLSVGVVGAGGLGSHVIQQLAHLGIGRAVVIDPDRVASSNLSRLVGASRSHALQRWPKTRVARRLARRIGGPTQVDEVRGSVTDEAPARRLLDCDVIIGCTDNQWSRTVLNAIAYQYYVPVLDLGVELQMSGAMGGRVTWLAPGVACLWCQQILNARRVRAEQLPAETHTNELARGYIEGFDEPAPAVVSINGVVASLAVTELLARTTGFAGSNPRPNVLMYRISDGVVRRSSAMPNPTCPTCSPLGQLGLGDLGTAPWTLEHR
jgi:molybdopterin/thiamine biosynthesis adenylyltransferase